MKNQLLLLIILSILLFSCKPEVDRTNINEVKKNIENLSPEVRKGIIRDIVKPQITLDKANIIAELPLYCVQQEYPNKLSQVIGDSTDLKSPRELHPAFYGCFDWHSSVHGHWAMVRMIRDFPELEKVDTLKKILKENLTAENILKEVEYFNGELNKSSERTYGWAWLLKLAEELHTWKDPLADSLEMNLKPLTDKIVANYMEFLPKLMYPIRSGEHTNTAFGLSFAYDYANTMGDTKLKELIRTRAIDFYINDKECPLAWEPSGFDFLSPCLEEMDLMRRILDPFTFKEWLSKFAPNLIKPGYKLPVGKISDRNDGKLVHLDGLNFSRAWVLYGIANELPEYEHLVKIADEHVTYALPHLIDDGYEGGHWLGTFAIYAIDSRKKKVK